MNDEQKKNLKAVLEVGVTVQAISTIVAFCIRTGKTEFLTKLNKSIAELNKTLTDEEKQDLRKDMDAAMDQKAKEFLTELGAELSEEELDKIVSELKSLASNQAIPPSNG
jgi:flagellin-specific chaperone FliS